MRRHGPSLRHWRTEPTLIHVSPGCRRPICSPTQAQVQDTCKKWSQAKATPTLGGVREGSPFWTAFGYGAQCTTIARAREALAGLAEFEHVMAADAPAVVLIDRALIRALLRYVRRPERDAT
jgi:hypothetical protein